MVLPHRALRVELLDGSHSAPSALANHVRVRSRHQRLKNQQNAPLHACHPRRGMVPRTGGTPALERPTATFHGASGTRMSSQPGAGW